jgi:hypothetical protein
MLVGRKVLEKNVLRRRETYRVLYGGYLRLHWQIMGFKYAPLALTLDSRMEDLQVCDPPSLLS